MISVNKSKITILSPYMEIIGPLVDLVNYDGALFAKIAGHIVVLPIELKDALMQHLGCRIAILRTDIPGKEYLYRIIPEMNESTPMTAQNLCGDELRPNYSEVV
jgi:hypothetical protein